MISRLFVLLFAAATLAAAPVEAQSITAENASAAIQRVFEQSQQARDIEAYTSVIETCEEIAAAPIDEKKIDYANKLAAWAYNRRGEKRAEEASLLADKGEQQQAEQIDTLALADFNRSLALDATKWKAYHNRGVSHAVKGDYEAALADFSRSLELEPEYSNTWFNRGEIEFEEGNYQKAIDDYNQALRLKADDLGAISRRGRAYAATKQYGQAIDDFTRLLRLAPQNAETYVDRAEAQAKLHRWQQAANDYRQAIRLDDELGRAYQGAAWLMATSPNEQFRNPALALQAAQKAVELDGRDDFRYLDTLAAALANAGQYEQAITQATAAAEAAPDEQQAAIEQRRKLYEANQPYRQAN
jgi:tetratricopeptide (TPR) repeat protein